VVELIRVGLVDRVDRALLEMRVTAYDRWVRARNVVDTEGMVALGAPVRSSKLRG
jgi:phage terminase small subunit